MTDKSAHTAAAATAAKGPSSPRDDQPRLAMPVGYRANRGSRGSRGSIKRKRNSKIVSRKMTGAQFPLSHAFVAAQAKYKSGVKRKEVEGDYEEDYDDDEDDSSYGSSDDSEDDAEEKKQQKIDAKRKRRRVIHEAFLFGDKNMLPSEYEKRFYLPERTFPRSPVVSKDKEPVFRAIVNYDPVETVTELMNQQKSAAPKEAEPEDRKKQRGDGDDSGVTLLHVAAMCGRSDLISLLAGDGTELEARDRYDNTPLHYAAFFNEPETTLSLLNCALKLKRNIVNRRNESGMTALYIAAAGGFTSICRVLKQYDAQMKATGPQGRSPLHEAVLSMNLNCVEQLIEDGADPNMCDSFQRTPLHYASLLPNERRDIMAAIMKPMTSFDTKDKDNMTALEYAVMHGYDSCISLFTVVKNGSNVCLVYDIRARMEKHCAPPLPDPPRLTFIPFTRIKPSDSRTGRKKRSSDRGGSNPLSRSQSRLAVLTPPPRAKNRYGFCVINALNKAEELTQKEKDAEELLAVKWAKLLPDWDKLKRSAIEKLCIGGVPEALRGEIWKRLVGVPEAMRKQPDEYKTLRSTVAQRKVAVLIDADIQRCHLDHSLFAVPYSGGQIALFNVMKAYSLYDAVVGYTQGMTDLAGLFLMYMSEEDTFWLLVQLMFDSRWDMHGLFTDGFPLVAACCHVQSMLISKFFPDLAKHMSQIGFDPAVINGAAMEWYMTLFSRIVPFRYLVRIFDVVFCKGFSSVFQFAMAFFHLLRPKLLQIQDRNVFVETLKAIPSVICDIKPNDLVQLAIKYKSAPSLAERYSTEFRRQHGAFDSPESPPTSPSTGSVPPGWDLSVN